MRCGCTWQEHIHLTYEYVTDRTYLKDTVRSEAADIATLKKSSADDINRYIKYLQQEAEQIRSVYKQLAEFLQANAMFAINDQLVLYLDIVIHEERNKHRSGEDRRNIVVELERVREDYKTHFERLKRVFEQQPTVKEEKRLIEPQYVINLVETLYALPINGKSIRDQMVKLASVEATSIQRYEREVVLSSETVSSTLMAKLTTIFPS